MTVRADLNGSAANAIPSQSRHIHEGKNHIPVKRGKPAKTVPGISDFQHRYVNTFPRQKQVAVVYVAAIINQPKGTGINR